MQPIKNRCDLISRSIQRALHLSSHDDRSSSRLYRLLKPMTPQDIRARFAFAECGTPFAEMQVRLIVTCETVRVCERTRVAHSCFSLSTWVVPRPLERSINIWISRCSSRRTTFDNDMPVNISCPARDCEHAV